LRSKYDAVLKDITSRYDAESAQLPAKYLKAVEAIQFDSQAKGDLQGVVAAKRESAQFALASDLPAEDGTELAPALKTIRAKYRQQVQQLAAKRDKEIVTLVQQYAARLSTMEKQLTKDGKIDEALAVHGEVERVKSSKEAQAAIIATYTEPAASAVPVASSPPQNELTALLAAGAVPDVTFTDNDVRQKAEVLNHLVDALSDKGVKLRLNANSIPVESITYERGVPRYHCRYVADSDFSRRRKTYTLTEASALQILQSGCALLGLGYRLRAAESEVELLDPSSPDVEWTVETTPLDQITKDLTTAEGRKRFVGRFVLTGGGVSSTGVGLNAVSITLTNHVRLAFARTPANVKKVAEVQTQNGDATRAKHESPYVRHCLEVTALGVISSQSSGTQLTLDDCALLECYAGSTYGMPASRMREPIRIDQPAANRNIRRIGE